MILKLLRDNYFMNSVGRFAVQVLLKVSKRTKWIADKYRIYGAVNLQIEKIKFTIYAEADDFIANDIYYGINYEADEFKLIKARADHSRFFLDIGSNTGIFSVFASRANKALKVISFEPHPENYQRLLKNASLNDTSIESFPHAVGNLETSIDFTIPSDGSLTTISSANDSFTRNFRSTPFRTVRVKQVTLDSLLNEYPLSSRDLIKIDVEYYELEVLKGATKVLSTIKPWLLLEVLDYNNLVNHYPQLKEKIQKDHAQQIEGLLLSFGYFAYELRPDGIKMVNSVADPHEQRNFLFIPVRIPKRLISYQELNGPLICK